jgi:hypothetical protein
MLGEEIRQKLKYLRRGRNVEAEGNLGDGT